MSYEHGSVMEACREHGQPKARPMEGMGGGCSGEEGDAGAQRAEKAARVETISFGWRYGANRGPVVGGGGRLSCSELYAVHGGIGWREGRCRSTPPPV